ncbi:TPA: EpsG family protein [Klebsiella quasipneumoniae subsp. similipneumoniae]|uniref:EpsG family protein n=1 Tax=Klebsiella quasipneumoniae TaxID=1463165 RepID=UPI0029DD274E|nr:EpsG family protein [Klebsiella quasipneumoniae]MDX6814855.1 EpsG family protein [Klebsiella quasipneumoniae]HBR1028450.1 EpsG family protein [Klebsiella quasipneumoniae subsp. similipneumoniae]
MNNKFIISFWSFLLLFIMPVVGFITSFFALRPNKNNSRVYFIISLFYFFFMIRYPPFSDSYFRYLQYQSIYSFSGVLSSGNDILFYLSAFIAKKVGIDFFFIPAFYSFLMVYFSLCAFGKIIDKEVCVVSDRKFILAHVVFISTLNILNWAAGIRYGMAMVWMVAGIVNYIYNARKVGAILICFSVFMHFSMLFFIPVVIFNQFYKVKNKKIIIPVCAFFYFLSTALLPLILSNMNFWGISDHSSIYVDGMYARQNSNYNALFLSMIVYVFFGILVLYFVLDKKNKYKIDDITGVCSMAIFLSASSVTGFGRFITLCDFFLLSRLLLTYLERQHNILSFKNIFLLFYCVINLFLLDIYLQRDQIFLAKMWQGLYKSPVTLLEYSQVEYNKYLYQINADGTWIKHDRDSY